ncbi:MAG: hypothetical protein GX927_01500, partial [Lentisphaerae bacterium]|nr:hypothetical protein [Lentisphaerota bacterium]
MKSKLLFLLLTILTCCQLDAQMAADQAALLCSEAEALFHEANEISRREPARALELCRNAAARYERVLLESNLQNSKI